MYNEVTNQTFSVQTRMHDKHSPHSMNGSLIASNDQQRNHENLDDRNDDDNDGRIQHSVFCSHRWHCGRSWFYHDFAILIRRCVDECNYCTYSWEWKMMHSIPNPTCLLQTVNISSFHFASAPAATENRCGFCCFEIPRQNQKRESVQVCVCFL